MNIASSTWEKFAEIGAFMLMLIGINRFQNKGLSDRLKTIETKCNTGTCSAGQLSQRFDQLEKCIKDEFANHRDYHLDQAEKIGMLIAKQEGIPNAERRHDIKDDPQRKVGGH